MSDTRLPAPRSDGRLTADHEPVSSLLERGLRRLTAAEKVAVPFNRIAGYGESIFVWREHPNLDMIRLFEFGTDGSFVRVVHLPLKNTEPGFSHSVSEIFVRAAHIIVLGELVSRSPHPELFDFLEEYRRETLQVFSRLGEQAGSLVDAPFGPNHDRQANAHALGFEGLLDHSVSGVTDHAIWSFGWPQFELQAFEFDGSLSSAITIDAEFGFPNSEDEDRDDYRAEVFRPMFNAPTSDPWRNWECCNYHVELLNFVAISRAKGIDIAFTLKGDEVRDTTVLHSGEYLGSTRWTVWDRDVCFPSTIRTSSPTEVELESGFGRAEKWWPEWAVSHFERNLTGMNKRRSFRLPRPNGSDSVRMAPILLGVRLFSLTGTRRPDGLISPRPEIEVHDLDGRLLNRFETRAPSNKIRLQELVRRLPS